MSVTSSSEDDGPRPGTSKGDRRRRPQPKTPQQKIDDFWDKYKTKAPGKATSIIPQQNDFSERAAKRASAKCLGPAKTTQQSYEDAAAQCRHKVAQIVKECRRVNQKYRDPHFDLEIDLKLNRRDCLDSLDNVKDDDRSDDYIRDPPLKDRDQHQPGSATSVMGMLDRIDRENAAVTTDGDGESKLRPQAVKRVVDIFDDPKFFIDGPTAHDVRQGRDGDCWLMAALCTISNKPGLIERCCVVHDHEVGVYGFVFHRDGEWFSEIIDDKLYLTKPDYDERCLERMLWEDRERVNSEEAYRKIYQSNSGALYFAQCENPNETWLPLLEKAYAKAHGDYAAIEGGYGGEGIEDLTGGVTSEIYTTDILDKEHFWTEELMKVNQDFLFGCSTGVWGRGWGERKGIVELHAYSVLKAREIDGVRLVLLKNPWGKHEWKGAWSDGSKEWTAEWLQKLDHKFGDDGSFWISYDDLLKKYQAFDRTRLFDSSWKVASIWTTLNVPWTLDYHDTKFAFSLLKTGPVVIVCSQLDERYFKGLEGQYRFELSFRLHKSGEEDYVVRSQGYYRMNRSINVELELEAGDYVVVVKIDALRNEQIMPVEDVIRAFAKERREKLLRIGFAYDLAHSKGRIVETPEEKSARESYEKKKRDRERKKMAKLIMKQREEDRKHAIRQTMKKKKATEKARARAKARDERRQARREAKEKAEEEQRKKKDEEECADKSPQGTTAQGDTTSAKAKGTKGTDRLENKDSEAQAVPGDQKGARLEIPSDDKSVAEGSKDGNDSSTEPGDNTPASSTMFERTPVETEETQEEDAYVTAAEEGGESQPTASMEASKGEEPPPTPRVSQSKPEKAVPKKSADKAERPLHNHVDIGVQTGPGLPLPPRTPGPPPGYLYSPPPPPPPRGPVYDHPRGQRHALPPHLRGIPYASMRPPPPPPPGASSSCTSDASTDDGIEDLDSVSEVSEHEIDLYLEAQGKARAAAARAAKANQPSSPSPPSGPTCEDELNEFEKDPWNAVGVFGLRVYYKSDSGNGDDEIVKLRVERPNQWMWEDDSDDEADDEKEKGKGDDVKEAKEEANESQVLDIDDSGKDAVAENVTAEEKKEDEKALEGEASAQTAPGDVEVVKQAGQHEGDSSKDTEIGQRAWGAKG
ncbi:calpain family cysteine protease [Diaporthe eres]|uniref:Calpain catalytic domain-containing protein n=2 Tax=Diaporthe vaccinii TaxID=105482 RepID=A0ABR4FCG6_9PEZI|nr:calpain family cysteine protease [Diaporthe eres]